MSVAVATLTPRRPVATENLPSCLLCGPYASADALLNVLIFVPLGLLGGARRGRSGAAVVLLGLLLTAVIELTQKGIPGRYPAVSDAAFNFLGVVLGYGAAKGALALSDARARARNAVALGITLLSALLVAGAGWLLAPEIPDGPYTILRGTRFGHVDPYPGRVLDAALGAIRLRAGPVANAVALPDFLRMEQPLAALVTRDTLAPAEANVLGIYDARMEHIVSFTVEGPDVLLQQRLRARRFRFHEPRLRFSGALAAAAPGDTLLIRTRTRPGDLCLDVVSRVACGLRPRPAEAWRLLYDPDGAPSALHAGVSVAWLAVVAALVAALATRGVALGLTAALAWYVAVRAPVDTALRSGGWLEVAALAGGCILVLGVGYVRDRRAAGPPGEGGMA